MNRNKQMEAIVKYLRQSETPHFVIGAELEYFVVDKKTQVSVPFSGKHGIESLLQELLKQNFHPIEAAGRTIGIYNQDLAVTLEPGAQWEISLHPQTEVVQLKNVFLQFLQILNPLLESRRQVLHSAGYLPVSTISEIELLPKQRYRYMYEYFGKAGKYAHNMMKGTASIQVAVDYLDEQDFSKKMRLASRLTPIFSAIYDNATVFEGNPYHNFCLRTQIWDNCDDSRCGIIPQVFAPDFGYERYAEYILNLIPILINRTGEEIPYEQPFHTIFDLNSDIEAQLNHIFSMCFPDVRARKYIELRMTDSLPYPFSFAFIELIDIIFNNQEKCNKICELLQHITLADINQAKKNIIKNGIHATFGGISILSLFAEILKEAGTDNHFQQWNRYLVEKRTIPRNLPIAGGKFAAGNI